MHLNSGYRYLLHRHTTFLKVIFLEFLLKHQDVRHQTLGYMIHAATCCREIKVKVVIRKTKTISNKEPNDVMLMCLNRSFNYQLFVLGPAS